jgi:hypothetical protein
MRREVGEAEFLSGATIAHSTITGNRGGADGGGIYMRQYLGPSSLSLDHTIVAGNTAGAPHTPSPQDVAGPATLSFSLLSANKRAILTDNGGNLIGTAETPLDPRLGALANNGGAVSTHALSAGSPAIDAGNAAAVAGMSGIPTFDQRGAPFWAGCRRRRRGRSPHRYRGR